MILHGVRQKSTENSLKLPEELQERHRHYYRLSTAKNWQYDPTIQNKYKKDPTIDEQWAEKKRLQLKCHHITCKFANRPALAAPASRWWKMNTTNSNSEGDLWATYTNQTDFKSIILANSACVTLPASSTSNTPTQTWQTNERDEYERVQACTNEFDSRVVFARLKDLQFRLVSFLTNFSELSTHSLATRRASSSQIRISLVWFTGMAL
jgi:hypothetical protein